MLAITAIAIVVSATICWRAAGIGRVLGVLDRPDNARKLHRRVTPQIGGVAVLAGFLLWLVIENALGFGDSEFVTAVMLCGSGVALVGFTDDQNGTTPLARLAFLVVFMLLAFALDSSLLVPKINSMLFVDVDLPVVIYCALVVIAALGIVNSVNMADGQDGIAGGMFAIWTACLAYSTTGYSRSIAAVLHVLCLVFLVFNLKPRGKVFLGDCGSYGITFIIGLLVILAHASDQVQIETVIVWFFIPVIDCLRVVVERMRRGRSPFLPDRDHFHHRLEDRVGKAWGLVVYLGSVGISSLISTITPHWAPLCLCILSGFYFGMAGKRTKEAAVAVVQRADLRSGNVISIANDRGRVA
jgi:UDP-GlcNAc:undecaprenyl-phosphate GlcNAc-1-phosphate transferase